jgi:NCAIR mutase (PurE)-related protein
VKTCFEDVLKKVYEHRLTPEEALEHIRDYPYQDLDYAKIDHHRELRKGAPEIIFGLGKTPDQILKIARAIVRKGSNLLVTRAGPDAQKALKGKFPGAVFNPAAGTITLKQKEPPPGKGKIIVMTAGTSDIPVAEEAVVTCEILGNETEKVYDVGVAGLHRLFGEFERIKEARVVITVAGMEGALPSVVAGLVRVPVVAVPTSVGYGASFKGLAALLAMLNACPGGVAVVNIDNGFGGAYLASLINHL